MRALRLVPFALFATLLLAVPVARADGGFQLDHYEPTAAGTWFLAVDHPWYSSTRYFSAALTMDYAHNPLVYGQLDAAGNISNTQAVVAHQLVGHIDLGLSFLDRVLITASLPLVFYEGGNPLMGVAGAAPSTGVVVGDPRLGVMFRLWHQPDKDGISIHAGGDVWIPIGAESKNAGDPNARGLIKVVLAGITFDHLRWSASAAYLIRGEASIGGGALGNGSDTGQELQFAGAVQYTDHDRKWAIGPEFLLGSGTTHSHFFNRDYTNFEALASAHYLFFGQLLGSLGMGFGLGHEPGTPDFRLLARLAWAPSNDHDRDHDGILDVEDACPDVKGVRTDDPTTNGCPPDRDRDGVYDQDDICPDVPQGAHPDPHRRGCPAGDRDGDGVLDPDDLCPDVPQGDQPDPARRGCPLADRDHDGVPDAVDACPDVPHGPNPDPNSPGCPAPQVVRTDRDGDGIYDDQDLCPDVPAGRHPDPARLGCPLPDRDGDTIPDVVDACPDQPGAPDPDPKKNGCPGLVTIKDGKIVILAPVFFATDKDIILAKSFPVLTAVARALTVESSIKKVAIEGHTDSKGNFAHNMDLSDRRAKSVMRWLAGHGIATERMLAQGYGPTRPIAPNTTNLGRAKNRRVDFVIVDPAPSKAETSANAAALKDAVPPPQKGKAGKGKGVRPGKRGKRGR